MIGNNSRLVIMEDFLFQQIKRLNCDYGLQYQITRFLTTGMCEMTPSLIPKFVDLLLSCSGYIDVVDTEVSHGRTTYVCSLRAYINFEGIHLEPVAMFDNDDSWFFISDVYDELLIHFNPTGEEKVDDLYYATQMLEDLVKNTFGVFLVGELTDVPKSFHVNLTVDENNNIVMLHK